MKKTVIKCAIIVAVFIASLFILSKIMNQGNTDMTVEMGEASFPIVSVRVNGYEVNRLHGYAEAMDTAYIRNCLTPVGNDRKVSAVVDTYDGKISDMAFEVRSLDGERLVESTPIEDYQEENGKLSFDITLKDLIDSDTEYMLVFLISQANGEQIRYYTRILQSENLHAQEKLEYVLDFNNKTFDKEAAGDLTKYLESNAEGDNTTFHRVTIHSSFDQVTWGNLGATRVEEPKVTIRELTSQTGNFQLDYYVTTREGREITYYRVKEYYRVRYTPDRMYLLDYERDMDQIFDEKAELFTNNKIELGIMGEDIAFQESDGGNVFAFVAANKLYSYNVTDNKLARLFGFYGNQEELLDDRSSYDRHDIKILNVDETGNVSFAVYGYMNRGRHEGQTGIAVYNYNSMTNTVEEQVYIPSWKSYEILKKDMETLSHVNNAGIFYFMMNGCIYAADLENKKCDIVVDGLTEGAYHVSESQEMLVWQENGEMYSAGALTLLNLNTQKKTTIQAGSDEYISVLGFMDEDLIYGLAKKDDVTFNSMGAEIFPMYCVRIQNDLGEILKTYEKTGFFVTGSTIEQNQITLKRVVRNEETQQFEEESDDQIMSTEEARTGSNILSPVVTERYETVQQIAVKDEIDKKGMKQLTPKEVLFEGNRTADVPECKAGGKQYYVYGEKGLEDISTKPADAVRLAYEHAGVVVDDSAAYIWRKEVRSTRNQIMAITEDVMSEERSSMAVCLDTILKYEGISQSTQKMLNRGETVLGILNHNLQESSILDLTGCSLDSVLYYVNKDIPVLATLQDGNAVLIVGFNELNIVVMDPQTGTLYKKGMNDSTQWLSDNGNQFVTYVRKTE